ncbi:hypothetical protein KDN24_16735 [Bacillus sp. Bva_UNVM-123]|uniref:hypothetical protein n=1 Tax=Bacillus sp. Bva_UNVM-123 TaxID=2829798 RepID=UPI00391FBD41
MQSWLSEDRYSPKYNWLYQSKSPYLKQHETNPVNLLEGGFLMRRKKGGQRLSCDIIYKLPIKTHNKN